MEKTIKVEFDDEFVFPLRFDILQCFSCPLAVSDDAYDYCFVTNDPDSPCPFFDGRNEYKLIKE